MTYSDKLKNPKWQRKRLEILSRDKFTCSHCYTGENDGIPLHVHHLIYLPGKNPWEVPDDCLITLCERCHKIESEHYSTSIRELNNALSKKFPYSSQINRLTRLFLSINRDDDYSFISTIEYFVNNADVFKDVSDKKIEYLRFKTGPLKIHE